MRAPRLLLTTFTALAVVTSLANPAASALDRTVSRMTLKEKVGQLVMFSVGETGLTQTERDLIRRHRLGGVILFSKNYDGRSQLRALNDQIQRVVRSANRFGIGALISADQEGGVVKRFPDLPPWRSAPEIGATGDESVSYRQGRMTGRELREVGVNVNLAPVADLDLPPEHVMRSRSFGERPRPVGRMVRAFARGLQSKRTAATAKHFPGLGGATINSDYGRAYVYRSRRQLRRVDAVPLHRAVAGGTRLMMLSHGIYVNYGGPRPRRPASVNGYIATHRLRQEFGFSGVAISDALEPVAWKFGGSTPRACRATIAAGVDVALITGDANMARRCAATIRRAVRAGDISRRRINTALRRVLELKRWLGVFDPSS
ncbi:MAG: hypothetical protein M3N53_00190 [Actinomycetota bacterium]|nr:hypothetical protein [Actinomycetota bacterium]